MSDEKIYCGSARIVPTQYGELTKISFHKNDIEKLSTYLNSNSTEWVNLVVKAKKDPLPDKPTHYLEVDTWKPENKPQAHTPKQEYASNVNTPMSLPEDEDTLPF